MALMAVEGARQGNQPLLVGEGDEIVAGGLLHQALALGHHLLADAVHGEQADPQGDDGHHRQHGRQGAPAQAERAAAASHGVRARR